MMPTSLLPEEVNDVLRRVKVAQSPETKLRLLAELRLASLDIALLVDAQSRFRSGMPDSHKKCSQKMRFPVYEVRDRTGSAWRGAVVLHERAPWLVYADEHEAFHHRAHTAMHNLHKGGNLLPSSVDDLLKNQEKEQETNLRRRTRLLQALLASLTSAAASSAAPVPVTLDGTGLDKEVSLAVTVSAVPGDGWDAGDAHTHADIITLRLDLRADEPESRAMVIRTCLPFLQPDTRQIESVWHSALTVSILVSRARLVQLLANPLVSADHMSSNCRTPPTVLHYTDKFSLTESFVYGNAVRAVCGEWWVPRGDAQAFPDLPICTDCEMELPAAQVLKRLISEST